MPSFVAGFLRRRKSLAIEQIRRAAWQTSDSLSKWLTLKRIAELKDWVATPIACKTGEGSKEPLEHAEPVEHAIPARSSFMSRTSAWHPGKETLSA